LLKENTAISEYFFEKTPMGYYPRHSDGRRNRAADGLGGSYAAE
jgi:hypothetical protein